MNISKLKFYLIFMENAYFTRFFVEQQGGTVVRSKYSYNNGLEFDFRQNIWVLYKYYPTLYLKKKTRN